MRTGLFPTLLFMAALANPPGVRGQDTPADTADIHTALRAFYFSLSHRDWEAIAGQVLSAKVVAHRPPPDAMVAAEGAAGRAAGLACGESRVTLDGAWAEASVVRCGGAARGVDEFRLIRFQRRWRIVYIDLSPESASVAAAATR
jgi:hypothetical protein